MTSKIFGYADASILDLLDTYPDFVGTMDCLITCVDSSRNVRQALLSLTETETFEIHGEFVVVPGARLVQIKETLFSGFEEFYCFERGQWRKADPSLWTGKFTSETFKFRQTIPHTLLEIMRVSGALRYASDGDGLNMLAEKPDVIERAIIALGRARSGASGG